MAITVLLLVLILPVRPVPVARQLTSMSFFDATVSGNDPNVRVDYSLSAPPVENGKLVPERYTTFQNKNATVYFWEYKFTVNVVIATDLWARYTRVDGWNTYWQADDGTKKKPTVGGWAQKLTAHDAEFNLDDLIKLRTINVSIEFMINTRYVALEAELNGSVLRDLWAGVDYAYVSDVESGFATELVYSDLPNGKHDTSIDTIYDPVISPPAKGARVPIYADGKATGKISFDESVWHEDRTHTTGYVSVKLRPRVTVWKRHYSVKLKWEYYFLGVCASSGTNRKEFDLVAGATTENVYVEMDIPVFVAVLARYVFMPRAGGGQNNTIAPPPQIGGPVIPNQRSYSEESTFSFLSSPAGIALAGALGAVVIIVIIVAACIFMKMMMPKIRRIRESHDEEEEYEDEEEYDSYSEWF